MRHRRVLRTEPRRSDRFRNYNPDTVEEMLGLLDKLSGTNPHYPMGWAMAGDAPLKRWKQDTHHSSNTDPLIISWPRQIKGEGEFRAQYHHVVDIVPTLLEIHRAAHPDIVAMASSRCPFSSIMFRQRRRADAAENAISRCWVAGRSGQTAGRR